MSAFENGGQDLTLLLAYTHLHTAGDVENGHFRTPTTELYQALFKRDRGSDEENEACYGVSLVMARTCSVRWKHPFQSNFLRWVRWWHPHIYHRHGCESFRLGRKCMATECFHNACSNALLRMKVARNTVTSGCGSGPKQLKIRHDPFWIPIRTPN